MTLEQIVQKASEYGATEFTRCQKCCYIYGFEDTRKGVEFTDWLNRTCEDYFGHYGIYRDTLKHKDFWAVTIVGGGFDKDE